MDKKKKYRIYMSLELIANEDISGLNQVNILRMSSEKIPFSVFAHFLNGIGNLAKKVEMLSSKTYGRYNQYAFNPGELDCDDYEHGDPHGMCDGMGHYKCEGCKWRSEESIRQKHEEFMYGLIHKKEWEKIKARVIETGEEVNVDDQSIDGYYNMWHETKNGILYHDDELEFIDERLQKHY